MITSQTIDGVPRELLESFAAYVADSPNAIMRARAKELRALLDAPAENVIDVSASDWAAIQEAASESTWMPPEYMRNDWVSDVCRFLREGAAAQLGAEGFYQQVTDADIKKISDYMGNPDMPTGAFLRQDAYDLANMTTHMCREVQALRNKLAAQPQGEPIYQVMYRGDGGGGWCDAEKDSYDMKVPHPKHWRTRIVYAEQPAPVAVVLPDLAELARLAEAATAGPWVAAGPSFGADSARYLEEVLVDREGDEDDTYTVCAAPAGLRDDPQTTADMAFIAAASPDAVLALIDQINKADPAKPS